MKVNESIKIRVPTAKPSSAHSGKKGKKGYNRKNKNWKKEYQ